MAAIVHPLLTLLASLTRQELARQVTYLKAENQILRSKLPKRIELSNQERRRLVKHGKSPGNRIKELISIVSYSTFRKWVRELEDTPDTWAEFLKRHGETMWQCDFACKRKWTIRGMVDLYFLVFIHLGTRRIWVSPCTAHPTGQWTTQQARNFDMFLQEEGLPCEILQRDHDSKYVQPFDDVFTGAGRTIKKTPIKSANLQAFVERVIQTLKHEVLNGFCVVSEQHLDYILRVGADWYNRRRGHSGRDHLPPVRDEEDPPAIDLAKRKLVCHTELGGHLKSYRAAA